MKYKSLRKKIRKQKMQREYTRRMSRLNEIAGALMNNMTEKEKYQLVTGGMIQEMKAFFTGLYRLV